MSVIKRSVVEKNRPYRWVTILPGDEALGIPDLKFKIGYINDKHFASLVKPYERKGEISMNSSENAEFRKSVIVDAVSSWDGMCPKNAMRVCSLLMTNPELLDGAPSVMPFDVDDLAFIGENISAVIFKENILDEATDLDAYAKDRIKAKVKPTE